MDCSTLYFNHPLLSIFILEERDCCDESVHIFLTGKSASVCTENLLVQFLLQGCEAMVSPPPQNCPISLGCCENVMYSTINSLFTSFYSAQRPEHSLRGRSSVEETESSILSYNSVTWFSFKIGHKNIQRAGGPFLSIQDESWYNSASRKEGSGETSVWPSSNLRGLIKKRKGVVL